MGDWARPSIAMHCFNNLIDFLAIHKYNTDAFALQWRTLLLNVMLSEIENIQHIKVKDICKHFNLHIRTIQKYKCGLPVDQIQLPEGKKSYIQLLGKEARGVERITNTKKYWCDHLVTSPKKDDFLF